MSKRNNSPPPAPTSPRRGLARHLPQERKKERKKKSYIKKANRIRRQSCSLPLIPRCSLVFLFVSIFVHSPSSTTMERRRAPGELHDNVTWIVFRKWSHNFISKTVVRDIFFLIRYTRPFRRDFVAASYVTYFTPVPIKKTNFLRLVRRDIPIWETNIKTGSNESERRKRNNNFDPEVNMLLKLLRKMVKREKYLY